MKKTFRMLSFACISLISINVFAEGNPMVILKDKGIFERNFIPRKADWLGLVCEKNSCSLTGVRIAVGESEVEGVVDTDKVDLFFVEFERPIAIFTGLNLNAREKVTTWFLRNSTYDEDYDSPAYKSLKLLNSWKMPWGASPLILSWVKLPENAGFRYHLSNSETKQFLFQTQFEGHYGGDTTPNIIWVGDLDEDQKIDFILSLPDDNCGFDVRLYLSSAAKTGELVHKSAQISGRWPACGC